MSVEALVLAAGWILLTVEGTVDILLLRFRLCTNNSKLYIVQVLVVVISLFRVACEVI